MGSDAAIEAADVVIMDDDLRKIPTVMRIAAKTMRIVRENIVFALGVKLAVLILGALGIANMWLAIFSDVGVLIIVILNSLRITMRRPCSLVPTVKSKINICSCILKQIILY